MADVISPVLRHGFPFGVKSGKYNLEVSLDDAARLYYRIRKFKIPGVTVDLSVMFTVEGVAVTYHYQFTTSDPYVESGWWQGFNYFAAQEFYPNESDLVKSSEVGVLDPDVLRQPIIGSYTLTPTTAPGKFIEPGNFGEPYYTVMVLDIDPRLVAYEESEKQYSVEMNIGGSSLYDFTIYDTDEPFESRDYTIEIFMDVGEKPAGEGWVSQIINVCGIDVPISFRAEYRGASEGDAEIVINDFTLEVQVDKYRTYGGRYDEDTGEET